MTKRPQAVLWDMDGTLIDTEPYWIGAEMELAREAGGNWTHEDGLSVIGQAIPKSAAMLKAKAGLPQEIDEIVVALLERVAGQMLEKGIPWQPGAKELLYSLGELEVPLALVTMSYPVLTNVLLTALPAELFQAVVTGDEVSRGKPDPEPYLTAATRLGIDISSSVAIEDSPAGVASALSAGANVIAVPHLLPIPAKTNLSRVNSLAELNVELLAAISSGTSLDLVAS